MIYAVDSESEIDEEENWIKSNPNLGVSVQLDYLQTKMAEAQNRPNLMYSMKTYHFGLWLSSSEKWLEVEKWHECVGEIRRESYVVVGVDLSGTQDLSSVCRIWIDGDRWFCDWMFWASRHYIMNKLPESIKRIYYAAEETGILRVQDSVVIDYAEIEEYVEKTSEHWNIAKIGVDPWNAKRLTAKWSEDGYPVFSVHQSPGNLNDSRQEVARRILSREIVHDGDPFLAWQLDNCRARLKSDVLHISKPDSSDHLKIDGFAALFTAARCVPEGYEPEFDPSMRWEVIPAAEKPMLFNPETDIYARMRTASGR